MVASALAKDNRRTDPITGRSISTSCWNGHHEQYGLGMECLHQGCDCMCHDWSGLDYMLDDDEDG